MTAAAQPERRLQKCMLVEWMMTTTRDWKECNSRVASTVAIAGYVERVSSFQERMMIFPRLDLVEGRF